MSRPGFRAITLVLLALAAGILSSFASRQIADSRQNTAPPCPAGGTQAAVKLVEGADTEVLKGPGYLLLPTYIAVPAGKQIPHLRTGGGRFAAAGASLYQVENGIVKKYSSQTGVLVATLMLKGVKHISGNGRKVLVIQEDRVNKIATVSILDPSTDEIHEINVMSPIPEGAPQAALTVEGHVFVRWGSGTPFFKNMNATKGSR